MDKRVVCIGFDANTLSQDQQDKVNILVKAQPDVLRVELYPNFDATSDERMPSGMVILVDPRSKVDPTMLSDEMFQTFSVSKVIPFEGQKLEDSTFNEMGEEINDAVKQFPDKPISGLVHNRHDNRELAAWGPELGGNGSFVGVYSQLREDQRNKDYFIVARGTAPLYVRDMKNKINAAKNTPTYGDLLDSKEWVSFMSAAEGASTRNVHRNIANVAEACGVQVWRSDDILNGAPHMDMNLSYPEKAQPEWEQPTHAIRMTQFERKPAVMLTYGVVPIDACFSMENDKFFVVANPFDGISAFTLTNRSDMEKLNGLPADTGRAKVPENVSTNVSEYASRIQGMVWEHKEETALVGAMHHVDLHKEAFRKVDKPFRKAMKSMGWNPDEDFQMERMVCVLAKIYNPQMRRQE